MLNRITMTGRLTADPALRQTPGGVSVADFSIACQRNFKNSAGERETDFFDVTAWRNTAEFVAQHFSRGSCLTVDGRLASRKYVDKNGNNRTAVYIVADNVFFGDSKPDGQKNQTAPSSDPGDFPSEFTEEDDLFPFL